MVVMVALGACMERPEYFRVVDAETKKHMDRMITADLFYPIKVVVHPTGGHLVVVDGLHRLMQAYAEDMENVWVEILDIDQLERTD